MINNEKQKNNPHRPAIQADSINRGTAFFVQFAAIEEGLNDLLRS